MSLRQGSVTDEYDRPVPGASVYVYDNETGAESVLTSDGVTPLEQPVKTDEFGVYSYYAPDALYREDTWYAGKLRYKEIILIGEPATLAGPQGPAGDVARVDTIVALKAAATAAPFATLARYVSEVGKRGMFVAKAAAGFAALIAADTQSAVYVPSTFDPTVVWVREFEEEDYLRPEWFGAHRDGVSSDVNAFNAMLALGRAMSTGAGSGVQQGPKIKLARGAYIIDQDFDCKGFCGTWEGAGGAFGTWANTGATQIKVSSGKSFFIQRSDTQGAAGWNAAPTVPFGADGSTFRDITFRGPGKGVGASPVVWLRANQVHFYNCHIIDAGSDGLYIYATAGSHTAAEGNANGWRWFGGSISNCGGSCIHTLGADANAGEFHGNVSGATQYGINEDSFLGNGYYGVHADGNTLGHVHGTGVNNASEFHGYWESGYPVSVIPPRSFASGTNSGAMFDGAAMGGVDGIGTGKSILSSNGFVVTKTAAGKTATKTMCARPDTRPGSEFFATDFSAGAVSLFEGCRAGSDEYLWSFGPDGYIMLGINGNGGGGLPRRSHGLVTPLAGLLALTNLVLGDGATPDGRRFVTGTAAWASGEHAQGERVFNTSLSLTAVNSWLCSATGTPGTWFADYSYPRADPATGIGYVTGAGGAVTQITSKATGVTLNKVCGTITTNNAALAAAGVVEFTVTDAQIAATDTIILNLASGAATSSAYRYWISGVAAGSFKVCLENRSAGPLSEALVFNFAVLKAVAA